MGEATTQLAISIAAKLDNDAMDALQGASLIYDGSAAQISYNAIVDAIDLFEEEVNTEKVMFVHPTGTERRDNRRRQRKGSCLRWFPSGISSAGASLWKSGKRSITARIKTG